MTGPSQRRMMAANVHLRQNGNWGFGMKNVPIIGKFLTIMAVFGLFAGAVAVYTDFQIANISGSYDKLLAEDAKAELYLARSNRSLQGARAALGDILMSQSSELNVKAQHEFETQRGSFIKYMDIAIAALPGEKQIAALKAEGLTLLDNTCAASRNAGEKATRGEDVIRS
ncbi:hypothetical protein [Ensifer soli]|uniref:hypothetical protein n=1 Tax=Ciceribacter sp. sgz301302 TaxID=3342379 RepID=UPI0035BB7429